MISRPGRNEVLRLKKVLWIIVMVGFLSALGFRLYQELSGEEVAADYRPGRTPSI
jgi:hypothetical protein